MKKFIATLWVAGIILFTGLTLQAQSEPPPPRFTAVQTTEERAVLMYWASQPRHLYQMECADELGGNPDGSTAWRVLCRDYPSHGTNTFIGDYGNYILTPEILHPAKMPKRFYRVVDTGADSAPSPVVTIAAVTNGASLSGSVTLSVAAVGSSPYISTRLYVDGQEVDHDDEVRTNYTINTCEWANGSHVLFATAKTVSDISMSPSAGPITIGHGVSAYTTVTFDNLIHKIAFSEPFFEPALGQTQQVSAAFKANVDWTLQILDESSNAVRTVTGSGTSLHFAWDGTGDGGVSLPDGVYYYGFSAHTNGQTVAMKSGLNLMSASVAPVSTEEPVTLWALPPEGAALPLAIYPPGAATNGFEIVAARSSEVKALNQTPVSRVENVGLSPARLSQSQSSPRGGATAEEPTPPEQTTVAPNRPPTSPVKNGVGSVGAAFYDHLTPHTYPNPKNGMPLPGNSGLVQLEGVYGTVTPPPIPDAAACVDRFIKQMEKKGWRKGFQKGSADLRINELRKRSLGGDSLFGSVNLGLFIDHGNYGTSVDQHPWASMSLQTYFTSANPADASAPWLAMSEFGFDGDLKWMGILACNCFRDEQYQSMYNRGVLPLRPENHLLCGTRTIAGSTEDLGENWAKNMTGNKWLLQLPKTVMQAWFDAGHDAYKGSTVFTSPVIFRVVGWDNCLNDTLKSFPDTTDGTITPKDQQVWP